MMKATNIMKAIKNSFVWGIMMVMLGLGLVENAGAGGPSVDLDFPEMQPEMYYIQPVRPRPIYLFPDFEITNVERVFDDSNPYQDFYRYDVTIRNRGGYCDGSQGGIRVEGVFTHTGQYGDYDGRCYVRVDPPAEWGDEVTVSLWDGISDYDNPNWWVTVIRIDDEDLYIESDERNNVWSCISDVCD